MIRRPRRRPDPVGVYDRPALADLRPKLIRGLAVVAALGFGLLGYLLVTAG